MPVSQQSFEFMMGGQTLEILDLTGEAVAFQQMSGRVLVPFRFRAAQRVEDRSPQQHSGCERVLPAKS